MDVMQRLWDAEYALKDHVEAVLRETIGPDWAVRCGIREGLLDKWAAQRKAAPANDGGAEKGLLAYCDLSDLAMILRDRWDALFSEVFGDLATMEVYLRVLERYTE
ncbi:MAG: hypothetical protein A4E73_03399 [Syntrophaceae bacterium PtaU1.Bin231]|nr:MAG: hypothetical protein A4E73_03399 [Syntrophaceae bacterium PtaU1.Bin231]